MNKEIITTLIVEKLGQIKTIKEKIDALNFQDEKITEYLEELTFTNKYLVDIQNELEENTMTKLMPRLSQSTRRMLEIVGTACHRSPSSANHGRSG